MSYVSDNARAVARYQAQLADECEATGDTARAQLFRGESRENWQIANQWDYADRHCNRDAR